MRSTIIFLLVSIFLTATTSLRAQNLEYVKEIVTELSSESMHGRGYLFKGDSLAANYLVKKMEEIGLSKFGDSYLQAYSFPMNILTGKMKLVVGNTELQAGKDYVIHAASRGTNKTFTVLRIGKKEINKKRFLKKLSKRNLENTLLLLDNKGIDNKEQKDAMRFIHYTNPFRAGAVFMIIDSNVIWGVSDGQKPQEFVKGSILRSAVDNVGFISVQFQNQFIPRYQTANLAGYLKGSEQPDSFIIFMGHYDHLGRMGDKTIFPGANDNASGTATVLDLARHFASLPKAPRYSMVFLLVSGEEAGLMGSSYFAANPLMPLSNVRFAVNFDMVGTGSDGIRVVMGTVNKDEYALLLDLNEAHKYLPQLSAGGESANSDHYPFHAKGVKTFFIFTMGKEHRHYHNPNDVGTNLPLIGYEGLFRLMCQFAEKLQQHE